MWMQLQIFQFPPQKRTRKISWFGQVLQAVCSSDVRHSRTAQQVKKKGQPFVWDDDCNKAFGTLKEKLANPPVLAFPDWKKPFLHRN